MVALMGYRQSKNGEHLSEDIDQLFELTRIIVLVLTGLVPSLDEGPVKGTDDVR